MATHIASELEANMKHFKWPDCVILTIMLLICVLIGLYFGIYRGYTNVQEYLMGGRKMKIFPITVSLVASYISAISILGIPTDIYLYGVHYLYSLGGFTLMIFIMNYIYLPVFYGLNLTSVYEYLERRFNKKVKLFGSLLYIINMILWSPMAIYVSALTFSQVTDVNVHVITPVLCTICAFYTSLGGVKAVVYTDVIQSTIMFAAMVLVAIIGTINVGGLYTVLARNLESGRIEGPNLDFNLSSKYTIWSLIVGGSINYLQIASINQNMLQRYLALPSISHAKKAVWFFVLEFCAFFLVCGYCGLLIYATFYKCNPLSTKLVKEKDQLLPLLAMQVLGDYPGLPGIFVAGILSASLSSLSTAFNGTATIILEDFYHFFFSTPLTEKQSFIVMKLTVVIFGVICVGMVYIIEQLGAILQMYLSIGIIATGPALGIFTMGVLFPWINAKGALIGGISSLIFMAWLCLKAQVSIAAGDLFYPEKPLTTDGCHYHFNTNESITVSTNATGGAFPEEKFVLYHISYLWYTLVGSLFSIIVGLCVSFITQSLDPCQVDPILLAPCLRNLVKSREISNDCVTYAFHPNDKESTNQANITLPITEELK